MREHKYDELISRLRYDEIKLVSGPLTAKAVLAILGGAAREAADAIEELLGELERFRTAEEDGRLIILPAQTVFVLQWDAGPGCNMKCPEDDSGEERCDLCYHGELHIYKRQMRQEHLDQIGETVFYGRGEAEDKRHEILKAMALDKKYD